MIEIALTTPRKYARLFFAALLLFGLYLSSLYSYLLFHTLAELFSIIVAASIFVLAWNSRRFLDNGYLLFTGIAYLFVGVLDLVHTLAYKGMGVFPAYDANLPTQLWIAARYLQGFSLLIAPFYLHRRLNVNRVIVSYSIVVILVLLSIFYWNVFPDCFIEGVGLTPFKKVSEYIIALILAGAMVLLQINRRFFDSHVLKFLVLSILASIVAELAFTVYADVYGLANMTGHIFKIIAFYFVYKAIIQTGFEQPYNFLFRNLKQSEEALRKAHDELEVRVEERTQALGQANEQLARANEELRKYRDQLEELVEARTVELQVEIKERQVAETALREANERLNYMLGSITDAYYALDFQWQFIKINPVAERIIFSRPAGELLGKVFWEEYPQAIDNEFYRQYHKAKSTGAPAHFEAKSSLVDRWFETHVYPRDGWLEVYLRDITDRKQAEARLQDLAQFPGENPNPVIRISKNGEILYANKASMELVNYWGCQIDECVPDHLYQPVLQALVTKSKQELEISIDDRTFIATFAPIVENGYVNLYAKDITERKRSEVILQSYTVQLARSNRELQDFASIASHDLQEPLRKILAFGGRLQTKYLPVLGNEGKDYIERMQNAASRMQTMLDDLLAYSRVTTKAQPLTVVDLNHVVKGVVSDLEVSIEENRGKLVLDELPTIYADPMQMRQLFQNLIGNALKFHQPGIPPEVRIACQPVPGPGSSAGDASIQILVTDNGIGFEEKYLDRIFQPFQRLHSQNEYKGSGMGLAICKKIVERHKGSITARSKSGQGATFIITLPVSNRHECEEQQRETC